MAIAGIDIGTTGSKISVYDESGAALFKSYRDYPASQYEGESDALSIWAAARDLLTEAARAVPGIRGVGVSSFGECFVPLDENDTPLMGVMPYTDPRGVEECAEFAAKLGAEHIADITGVMPHSMYSLPKLLWLKAHRPELLKKAKRVLLIEDYVVYMLTGVAQIDYSLATRTMFLDIRKLDWSDEILDAAGLDKRLFSKPVPTGTAAGPVKPELAQALGLPKDLLVVNCCHDQVAAAVGAGVFDEAVAVDGAGTTECVTPVFPMPANKRVLYEGGYAIVPYVKSDTYVTYAFSFTGGGLVKWFTQTLAGYAKIEADKTGASIFASLEKEMPEGPTGILVLPHFAGAGTPYMDEGARGAIAGLTAATTLSQMYKAVLEGVAYEMRVNVERLSEAGIPVKRLHATGGGAKSAAWLQIKADILGLEIASLGDSEAGIIGGILLTGVAVGAFSSLADAAPRFIKPQGVYTPDPERHEAYNRLFERYQRFFGAVKPLR